MKYPQWSEISYYFNEFEQQKEQLTKRKLTPEVLMTIRNSLTTSVKHLKNNLKQSLDEQSVYLITFALTALLDEEVQRILKQAQGNPEWLPVQKELFDLTNAGEVFFESLDEILEGTHHPAVVYEVYYFVLKKGFRGKYEHSANKISKYIEFISARVEEPTITKKVKKKQDIVAPLPKIKFKVWQYYIAAASVVMCVYIFFAIKTNT